MRFIRQPPASVDEENPYWVSFSDVMAALVVIFILASLVLLTQLIKVRTEVDKEMEHLQKAEEVRRTIVEDVVEELEKRSIEVMVAENHTVIRIPNDVLGFRSGKFSIDDRYLETARKIGEVLAVVIQKENRVDYLDTIFIEGHTDNRSFWGPPGKGNWGLSTFRAISLWEYWGQEISADLALNNLRNRDGKPLFSVSGYAETRPVVEDQKTEADYEINRRIDIRITIRRPAREDYNALEGLLGADDATPEN